MISLGHLTMREFLEGQPICTMPSQPSTAHPTAITYPQLPEGRRHSFGWSQSCPSLHLLLPQSLLTWTITKSPTVLPASCLTFLNTTLPTFRVIIPTVGSFQSYPRSWEAALWTLPQTLPHQPQLISLLTSSTAFLPKSSFLPSLLLPLLEHDAL